ncbi:GNAT family N-acetyltransferase [Glaesserella sp.]|uniref:GNAT family N-acetyltransferase n=1 Tax=Glaesserella sp. TaxID=2094731 RepID=UPI0035A16A08
MDSKTFWDNWVPIWAISRQIPPAKVIKNGYLFEEVNDGKREQELLLYSPKGMAEAEAYLSDKDYFCVSGLKEGFTVPKGWVHRLFNFMMINEHLQIQAVSLAEKFAIQTEKSENRFVVKIYHQQILASRGQIAYQNSYAVVDLIETNENYRRQGLATQVMHLLTNDAVENDATIGLLCASEQGKPLYETLGWHVIGQYSRMVKATI